MVMTTINAGGAFYRVQNSLNQNSEEVSKSMQRLASGRQNIAPGDRTASSAIAFAMKAEAASLKVGIKNGTEALQALEMVNNDLQSLNDIVVRLEELHALGPHGFNTAKDTAAVKAEALSLLNEMDTIVGDATWKGNTIVGATTAANNVSFGRNTDAIDIRTSDFDVATAAATAKTVAATGISTGTTAAATILINIRAAVDTAAIEAGGLYTSVSNTMAHLGNLNAGYALDVASKMDVDFAGETTELAKGQILAQAGTAMLAQANAQGQGMLALIQS